MNAVQLNTRMSADLRDRGNKAFASVGKTPSEVVRIVWEFAAENLGNTNKLSEFFSDIEFAEKEKEKKKKLEAVKKGANFISDFCKEHDVEWKPDPTTDNMTYKELRDYFFEQDFKNGE